VKPELLFYFVGKHVFLFDKTTHRVFNPNQFGYLSQKSTVSQLLLSYNDWAKARNEGNTTDVVFLDFAKAFDSVPHERLLYKLEQYGIAGSLLTWFRDFLVGRQQRVVAGPRFMFIMV
jgi:hypothetical protein